ncbi:hypothetical protein [Pseudomonas leptonychotis]
MIPCSLKTTSRQAATLRLLIADGFTVDQQSGASIRGPTFQTTSTLQPR